VRADADVLFGFDAGVGKHGVTATMKLRQRKVLILIELLCVDCGAKGK
jgi:hypothetical protein